MYIVFEYTRYILQKVFCCCSSSFLDCYFLLAAAALVIVFPHQVSIQHLGHQLFELDAVRLVPLREPLVQVQPDGLDIDDQALYHHDADIATDEYCKRPAALVRVDDGDQERAVHQKHNAKP
jgi:hypothetical protein